MAKAQEKPQQNNVAETIDGYVAKAQQAMYQSNP